MSSNNLKKSAMDERALDPNVLQRIASHPASSVWVGASAGSGKTKVLTDRMLRLLLPDATGRAGTAPHKILALTFTKAAASEMALRIAARLSEWAVMPLEADDKDNEQKGLVGNLRALLGQDATQEQITAARKLFAGVVDTPGGLKIMTIHSFCQSVLGHFPLEADLSPGFKPLEEAQAQKILMSARDMVFKKAAEEKGSPLAEAVHHLAIAQNEEDFGKLLANLVSERHQMEKILKQNFDVNGLYNALCQEFGIPAATPWEEILAAACTDDQFNESGLWKACKAMAGGTAKTDQPRADIIQKWLEA
ncbi:MAG TPA: UvrD-helicase domain-containing protein, partial [Alphaproteobacteria bacterium]|nr:UvrD-helicase domain-containing protein [Alphaproteobacteria bacterium]